MTHKVVLLRVMVRAMIALTLSLMIGSVLLTLVFYSSNLEAISDAGWALFGVGITALGASLLSIVRAMAQNPSDRARLTDED